MLFQRSRLQPIAYIAYQDLDLLEKSNFMGAIKNICEINAWQNEIQLVIPGNMNAISLEQYTPDQIFPAFSR